MLKGRRTLFAFLVLGMLVLQQRGFADTTYHLKDLRVVTVPLASGHARGPADAKVTFVEFADYTCPYTVHDEPVVRKVLNDYAGQVRFVVLHHWLPAHKHARLAAQVAIAAGLQGKFWNVHEMLLDKHFAAGPEGATIDGYLPYLKNIPGLDVAKLKHDVDSPEVNAALDKELAAFRSTATPEFLFNGHFHTGELTEAQFKGLIDEASRE